MSKHIFIVGGASGMGKALARHFIQAGHSISLFDIQDGSTALNELQALSQSPNSISFYPLDVCDPQAVDSAFAQAAQVQAPDMIIHTAGICQSIAFSEQSNEAFKRIIEVNLLGTRYVCAAGIKHLRANGQLVLFASMAGQIPCYGYSAYAASKAAVISFAEILRIELKPKGIRLSVVCPPEVETPMIEEERKHRSPVAVRMKLLAGHLSLEYASKKIYAGIERKQFMIIPGVQAKLLGLLTKFSPNGISRFVTDLLMPKQ